MPKLTKDQARELSRMFNGVAEQLARYRLDNFSDLSPTRRAELRRIERRLRDYANDFTDLAINLALADIEPVLKELGAVTKQVQKAIKRLKKVRDVIKIATSVVTLGAAIVTGNPSAIGSALGSLGGLVKGKK